MAFDLGDMTPKVLFGSIFGLGCAIILLSMFSVGMVFKMGFVVLAAIGGIAMLLIKVKG